jgi:hypothetical protein
MGVQKRSAGMKRREMFCWGLFAVYVVGSAVVLALPGGARWGVLLAFQAVCVLCWIWFRAARFEFRGRVERDHGAFSWDIHKRGADAEAMADPEANVTAVHVPLEESGYPSVDFLNTLPLAQRQAVLIACHERNRKRILDSEAPADTQGDTSDWCV